MMTTVVYKIWFLAVLLLTIVLRIDGYRTRCPSQLQSIDDVYSLRQRCRYGVFENNCSQHFCAKGPKEICGDAGSMFSYLGQCGDGLRCSCGRCMGCSLHFPTECYDRTCHNFLKSIENSRNREGVNSLMVLKMKI